MTFVEGKRLYTVTETNSAISSRPSRPTVMLPRRLVALLPAFALCAVLASSIGLAWLWAAMVPLFQSPDEPAHFQYAHALGTAKYILLARDGPPGFDPEVGLLMNELNTNAIAFHPEQAAPNQYGTSDFFAAADRDVPPLPPNYFSSPGHPVPLLLTTYPIGAYGIIGAYIAFLQSAFHAGIVEQVFGARDFCCALFVFGLLFWYLTFRMLRYSVPVALGLTALVGLFPLSSFVASYVQADNVTFALISPILYCSLRMRNGDLRLFGIGCFGFASALLLITKYQYALCLGVVTLPLVYFALSECRMTARQVLLRVVLIVVPSCVAIALQIDITTGAAQGYFSGPSALQSGVSHAFAGGAKTGLAYILQMVGEAYTNYFLGGSTMVTYWAGFGWGDTGVIFHDADWTSAVWWLIKLGTSLTIVFCFVLITRNLVRLRRISARRSARNALKLLAGNPVFNLYVVFAVFMFALFVASGNTFAAQGRNWYPVEGSAFATLLIYAPRALGTQKWRKAYAFLAGCFMVAYCTAGSYYCISAVESRYYHEMAFAPMVSKPNFPVSKQHTTLTVDQINSGSVALSARKVTVLPITSEVDIRGWALDEGRAANGGVYVSIDGAFAGWATEQDRPDVASALGNPTFARGGFVAHVALPKRPGRHSLRIMIVNAERTFVYPDTTVYRVWIR